MDKQIDLEDSIKEIKMENNINDLRQSQESAEKKQINKVKKGEASSVKQHETHQRYRVQFDFGYKGSKGKKMDPTSKTVPDMNLTIRQLLENHTRGKTNEVQVKQPLYFEVDIPTITDITDVDNYRNQLKTQLDKVNAFIKEDEEKSKNEAEAEKQTKLFEEMKREEKLQGNKETIVEK